VAVGRRPEHLVTGRRAERPVVFLHVGEPKSGTTFLQNILWANRDALARQGLQLPGIHPQDHFRANLDLREVPQAPDDPDGSYAGEWALLAAQACRAKDRAIISDEQLAAADDQQAARALRSLAGAEIHVILTVRDFVSVLAPEWQEQVKHRSAVGWHRWVARTRAAEPPATGDRRSWFWAVHDTLDVLRRWSQGVAPEHVHVVVTPPRGAPPGLLWERFASVIGVDPASVDLSGARPNASLGLAEVEVLRRLNRALRRGERIPNWFYLDHVKERLAHDVLAERPVTSRPRLAPRQLAWARGRAAQVIAGLSESGYRIVGDLAELRGPADDAVGTGISPRHVPRAEVLDAAVAALAATLRDRYESGDTAERTVAAADGWARFASPRVKRTVRELTARSRAVGRLRVLAWRLTEAVRSRRGRP
jgi:hypothetical protein